MTKILTIDDEPNNLQLLRMQLEDEGYEVVEAEDGLKGWEQLEKHDDIKLILLDRMMPNMNGMEFIAKIKTNDDYSRVPVIMQTAAADKDQVTEGIKAGVYYYLTKPYDEDIMLSVVGAALQDYVHYSGLVKELEEHKSRVHLVKECYFEVFTFEDIRYLSTLLANHFPDPERVMLGISELLLNAIEHGNLGITYDEKTQLKIDGGWDEELVRRQDLPQNANKSVLVHFKREEDGISLSIKDEGEGFDWPQYLDISPERATDNHGRGIALSKMMSFDEMEYKGRGNEVVCKVYTSSNN